MVTTSHREFYVLLLFLLSFSLLLSLPFARTQINAIRRQFQINASTTPPSATSGRKRSVLLLALSGVVALVLQYGFAPNYDKIGWQYLSDAWTSGCGADTSEELVKICAGNSGVFRASAAAFVFFFIFGIGEHGRPIIIGSSLKPNPHSFCVTFSCQVQAHCQ